jgi:hypothetical protein
MYNTILELYNDCLSISLFVMLAAADERGLHQLGDAEMMFLFCLSLAFIS